MGEILKQATYHNWSFWVCLITSIALIVISFFIPPISIIDGSVLAATGELFGFASLGSLLEAMKRGKDARITHKGTSFTVGDIVPPPHRELINEDEDTEYEEEVEE